MYDADTKHQFLELRAKGCSLARIAERLKVAQRTLVDCNRQEHQQIRTLRAIEMEELQEKILATRKQELTRLKLELHRLETELAKRTLEYVSTENLFACRRCSVAKSAKRARFRCAWRMLMAAEEEE